MTRTLFLPIVFGLALSFSAGAAGASALEGSPPELGYSVAIEPAKPELGGLVVFELRVEGLTAASASIVLLSLDPGLSLESESLWPTVSQSGRGTEFRFELRIHKVGELRIESLAISGAEGRLVLGPLIVCDVPAPGPEAGAAWRWVAPSEVLRYQAFEARLEAPGGGREGSGGPQTATFGPPPGASFDASGRLSWTVIAFEEGELVLPEAALGGGGGGHAAAVKISVKALPPEIDSSRAIGSFTLGLEGPKPADPVVGGSIRLRLVLEGRGNLPALLLPQPLISLGKAGSPAPSASWSSSRVDASRAEGGSYVGSTSLVLDFSPPRPGLATLRFPPLKAFDPLSGIVTLELPPLELRVRSAPAPLRGGEGGGQALADLYGRLRRSPPLSAASRIARKAALAQAAELGAEGPLLDSLPPPPCLAWPACLGGLAAIVLFLRSRGGLRRRAALSGLVLGLALSLGILALASAAERRASFAVVWTDTLRALPSADSELELRVVRGSTARIRGSSGNYMSLILSDGAEGWAPRDSLYFY
jgi:hypothetical protein